MRLAQAVRTGAWILVGLNLLMALGSIGIFIRMAPAITVIIERNERSLQACEDMLASLALAVDSAEKEEQIIIFKEAFERARTNVTEYQEPVVLESIAETFHAAFLGDPAARQATISAIVALGKINREAMIIADRRAQQLGFAGAWGIVFMAVLVFTVGMIFIRSITRLVVRPLEEIHEVISAYRNGETRRRCTGANLSQDIRAIFNGINEILDQRQPNHLAQKNTATDYRADK